MIYFLFQSYIWSLVYGHELLIPTQIKKTENLVAILKKTNDKLGAKPYRVPSASGAEFYIPGAYYTRFDQFIQETQMPDGFKVFLTHSTRNLRFLYLFQALLILPTIFVRSNHIPTTTETNPAEILIFELYLSGNPTRIDILLWFSLGLIIFLFFSISLSAVSENLLLAFEDVFKREKISQAISLPSLNLKKPDTSDLKDKLTIKKDSAISKLEFEKKRRVEEVMGILNPKKEDPEIKQMDPEVLRLEALIFNVRTVLQSTPSHRKIPIDELVAYFSKKVKTNPDELESIIFGLIQKKEVEGNYNIWDRVYSGGTPARRFVDKTLEFAETMNGELNSIKVKSDGSVEFYFTEDPNLNKKGNDSDNEDDEKKEKKNKFDSFE